MKLCIKFIIWCYRYWETEDGKSFLRRKKKSMVRWVLFRSSERFGISDVLVDLWSIVYWIGGRRLVDYEGEKDIKRVLVKIKWGLEWYFKNIVYLV